MFISIPLENGHVFFAEIKDGELIGIKEPTIDDYNKYPDKCLYFIQQIVGVIKSQKKMKRSEGE